MSWSTWKRLFQNFFLFLFLPTANLTILDLSWPVIGRDTFSALAPILGP